MHYLIHQMNKFYFSSTRNKAYLAVLLLLSAFILISILWHAYDTVSSVRLVYANTDASSAAEVKKVTARQVSKQSTAIFGSHNKMPERVNRSLKLLGVIQSANFRNSRAIIASRDADGEMYTVGDELSSGLKLHRVFDDRVILNRSGVLETLYLDWGDILPDTTITTRTVDPSLNNLKQYRGDYLDGMRGGYGDIEGISEKLRKLRESGKLNGENGPSEIDVEAVRERMKNFQGLKGVNK